MSTVPVTMKAAAVDRFGPSSALKLHTLPVPKPGPSQVLISLDAAGVGVWDAWIREGSWRPTGRAKFPLIPGTDGAAAERELDQAATVVRSACRRTKTPIPPTRLRQQESG